MLIILLVFIILCLISIYVGKKMVQWSKKLSHYSDLHEDYCTRLLNAIEIIKESVEEEPVDTIENTAEKLNNLEEKYKNNKAVDDLINEIENNI